nr:MAG TPA: hypothetical protein [Caudoviricetes sp.]
MPFFCKIPHQPKLRPYSFFLRKDKSPRPRNILHI